MYTQMSSFIKNHTLIFFATFSQDQSYTKYCKNSAYTTSFFGVQNVAVDHKINRENTSSRKLICSKTSGASHLEYLKINNEPMTI